MHAIPRRAGNDKEHAVIVVQCCTASVNRAPPRHAMAQWCVPYSQPFRSATRMAPARLRAPSFWMALDR